MSDILRLFARLVAIVLGFFAGCLAAGLAYAFLARLVVPEDFGRFSDLEMTLTLLFGVLGVASLFARAVLLPALALIAVFEFLKRRDWLSYALAGGALALAGAGALLSGGGPDMPEPARMIAVRTACAIIGASVYWLLAGRNAGRWLPSERAAPPASLNPEA